MTPAEWLAAFVVLSFVWGIIEKLVAPDAVVVKVNNVPAAAIRLTIAVLALVFAFIVLL